MKVFDLQCEAGHGFEGWFGSEEDYQSQCARGLLTCPLCGSAEVRRLPSAPYVHTGERGADTPEPSPPAPAPATVAPDPQRLAQLCTQVQLEPIHVMDVIEDFVADPCSWP